MKITVSDQLKLLTSMFTETSLLESSNHGATNGMETVTLQLKHALSNKLLCLICSSSLYSFIKNKSI